MLEKPMLFSDLGQSEEELLASLKTPEEIEKEVFGPPLPGWDSDKNSKNSKNNKSNRTQTYFLVGGAILGSVLLITLLTRK